MSTKPSPPNAPLEAELLAQAGWLRGLARQLVRDEASADDLVQETWRKSLEKPPEDRKALPAWLARVMRNTAAEDHRRTQRRGVRERRAAQSETAPAVADVVTRAEMHRQLVDALLALDEPFRSAVLMRYFDELTPKQIAARLGVPAATVRTRIHRALVYLRRQLDVRNGGARRAWVLAFASWTQEAGVGSAVLGGATAMMTGKKIAILGCVALSILVAAVALWSRPSPSEAPSSSGGGDLLHADGAASAPRLTARTMAPGPKSAGVEIPALPPLGPWGLRGTVRDTDGLAIAGARVELVLGRGGTQQVVGSACTDADGVFHAEAPDLGMLPQLLRAPAILTVRASASGFAPGPEDTWFESLGTRSSLSGAEPALVLSRGHVFRGRVLDTGGEPRSSVQVWATLAGGQARIVARSGPDGRWRGRIPAPGRYTIHAEAVGIGRAQAAALDTGADVDIDIPDLVLLGDGSIRGIARFPDGTPAAYVRVIAKADLPGRPAGKEGTRSSVAMTDASGLFNLRGLRKGRYALRSELSRSSESDPRYETGESAADLVIRVRRVLVVVQDPGGRPVAGAQVSHEKIHADGSTNSGVDTLGADGRVSLWAHAGEKLLLSADVDGSTYAEAVVDVRRTPWDRLVVLRLGKLGEASGSVRVQVTDEDGARIPDLLVTVRTELTGSLLRGLYEVETAPDGLLPAVPVGTWVLDVRPGQTTRSPPISFHVPLSETVSVAAEKQTDVTLVARRGGRIRLTLLGDDDRGLKSRDVSLALTALPTGAPRALGAWVLLRARGWQRGGLHLDAPCISGALLEPGRYRLVVQAPEHDRIEQEFQITAGEFVDLTMDLTTGSSQVGGPGPAGAVAKAAVDAAGTQLGLLQWEDEPVEDILAFIASKLGATLKLTKEARALVDGSRATCSLEKVSAETALNMMTTPFELTWNSTGKTLWIGKAGQMIPPR